MRLRLPFLPLLERLRAKAPFLALGILLVVGAGVGVASVVAEPRSQQVWHEATGSTSPTPSPSQTPEAKTITLGAVGDIVMGVAPDRLPANDGKGFFDKVKHLFDADLMMGNIEEPLTVDNGYIKCLPGKENCNQFRIPPHYANHLRDAGFDLLNQANNHGYDYGAAGYRNTQKAIEAAGIDYTGPRGHITMVDVNDVKVAVLGFSSYSRDNSLTDLKAAKAIVEKAAAQADVVVIQVHWGAEGADKAHVKPGTEFYLGENRGDPIKFSHTVIDAGADLIIGHGPHTVRAMEIYKDRLIAYSLGNFAGGRGLSGNGQVGWGGVLKATITTDGSFVTGQLTSTFYNSNPGVPNPDPQNRALKLIDQLSRQDFPESGAQFDVSGVISTL